MRQVLVIDDLRNFRVAPADTNVVYARTSTAGLAELAKDVAWDEIWLDHDLGQDKYGVVDSIMPCVDYMAERSDDGHPVKVERVLVHTSNPSGSRIMLTMLDRFQYQAEKVQAERYFVV